MTAETSTGRWDSTADLADEAGLQKASKTAAAIRERWQKGESPNVADALSHNPHLREYRSIVLDLAYQEYRLRRQSGEDLDAAAFSKRFPSLERSLHLLIEVHSLLSHDPDYQAIQGTLPWPEPGDRFLQFDLIAELGRGTFGRVFLAKEPSLGNRRVVVKVAPHGGEEAEILGRLRHPNIVPVYSLQEDDATGLAAFCMHYLGRATLCDVLDRVFLDHRPSKSAHTVLEAIDVANRDADLPESSQPYRILRKGSYVDGVVLLGVQLAEALGHSHGCGICHRDLKPSNVLMSRDGRPLLLDFNLSVDDGVASGKIGGTVPYMAPEELVVLFDRAAAAKQRRYDPRSDLFSLGVILYELLTGCLPFGPMPDDLSLEELARCLWDRQRLGPVPLRRRNNQIDPRLARLIERILAFEPSDRPESAKSLSAALVKEIVPVRRIRRWMGNHRKIVAGATGLLLTAILAVSLFFALRPPYSVRQYRLGLYSLERGQYEQAVESLNKSIEADPKSSEAIFARGRAYQRLGQFHIAYYDYALAHRLAPGPLLDACKGYCMSRTKTHQAAIAHYQSALNADYSSPAVLYNNLGFSYLRLARFDDARDALKNALQLDDHLQAAHYNMVYPYLCRSSRYSSVPRWALDHAAKAIALGPPTATLYRSIATLYVIAAKEDRSFQQRAIDCVAKAVELGCRPETIASDARFAALRKDPAFEAALRRPSQEKETTLSQVPGLIDPLDQLPRR